ncbi:hypothetical protein BDV40DRAFT_306462 [Aspergillus tamarii]|uniref:Methyltransferase domain-containing protein n=1 Tax=Aspergillus tamarii TaxID=41984 RepID=A0A5N6UBS3_ASPTM|nr:hypothetical protein BDV40DRAFT_306462 [Aspergillus tamarii]
MSDVYATNLRRDAKESERLDEQFDLLTEYSKHANHHPSSIKNIGYLVHPLILDRLLLDHPVVIADLATGTARFLQRISQSGNPCLKNAILHGSDLSPALFPPPNTLPSNIHLSVLDVRAPVPAALQGTYDFVHVRQIAAGLTPDD